AGSSIIPYFRAEVQSSAVEVVLDGALDAADEVVPLHQRVGPWVRPGVLPVVLPLRVPVVADHLLDGVLQFLERHAVLLRGCSGVRLVMRLITVDIFYADVLILWAIAIFITRDRTPRPRRRDVRRARRRSE